MPRLTISRYTCEFCRNSFRSSSGLNKHYAKSVRCSRKAHPNARAAGKFETTTREDPATAVEKGSANQESDSISLPSDLNQPQQGQREWSLESEEPTYLEGTSGYGDAEGGCELDGEGSSSTSQGIYRGSHVKHVIEPYPGNAGFPLRVGPPRFHSLTNTYSSSPLANPELWQLARWLMTSGLTARARQDFFKLKAFEGRLPWCSEYDFNKSIDSLPHGPDWECVDVESGGETHEIWRRNPISCVEELIGNPIFDKHIRYSPHRLYSVGSNGKRSRIYNEMWTADWWWDTQAELCKTDPQATIAPLILASDKTQLSVFTSNRSAWPVYLTLGNIPKALRRRTSLRASILIAYLPISKFLHIENKDERREAIHQLFHTSMFNVLRPLIEAGKTGVEMTCADSKVRRVYPIVASYLADFPEQCLIAACQESRCPICEVPFDDRGDLLEVPSPTRQYSNTLPVLTDRLHTGLPSADFIELGLRPIQPFWKKLPHSIIFNTFTPDVLHQLHKGIFKDHLFRWVSSSTMLGIHGLDSRYRLMPRIPSIRHFQNGVSHMKHTTGKEHREMEKVFLPSLVGLRVKALKSARAIMDFIYTCHFSSMDEGDLLSLDAFIRDFHDNKDVFEDLVGSSGFRGIPKLHALLHYVDSIRRLGTPDGYSTECPERFHIDYAKEGYRHSNRNNPIKQMTVYLQRQESVRLWSSFLSWSTNFIFSETETVAPPGSQSNEEEDVAGLGSFDATDLTPSGASVVLPTVESSLIHPCPTIAIANRPRYPKRTLDWISQNFGASLFLQTVNDFLDSNASSFRSSLLTGPLRLSPSELLNVWSRFRLIYNNHDLFPISGTVQDVVQTLPSLSSDQGSQSNGVSTTVLVETDMNSNGLSRYRAAVVRVIFKLPPRFSDAVPYHLAYIEFFSPFSSTLPKNHLKLYALSPSVRSSQLPVTAVVPLKHIKLICHVTPQFNKLSEQDLAAGNVPSGFNQYYLNEFSGHLMYAYMTLWKKLFI